MIKKFIKYFLNFAPIERMDPQNKTIWMRRIWEDHMARYEFAKKYVHKGNTLDIACGQGYGSAYLAPVSSQITGVDVSKDAIAQAKVQYYPAHTNLQFVADDAIHFLAHSKTAFDTIVSFETIEHLKEYRKFLVLVAKRLKRSGVCIVSTPNKLFSDVFAGGTFNEFHVKEFYTNELVDMVVDIFGAKPLVFLQRPVDKNHLILGTLWSFFRHGMIPLVRQDNKHEGVCIVLVARKK